MWLGALVRCPRVQGAAQPGKHRVVFGRLCIAGGESVLEIGCGTGALTVLTEAGRKEVFERKLYRARTRSSNPFPSTDESAAKQYLSKLAVIATRPEASRQRRPPAAAALRADCLGPAAFGKL